jgi:phage-related protein
MSNLGLITTSGGKDILMGLIKLCSKKDQAKLNIIIDKIKKDGFKALENLETRPIEKPLVYEIKKGNWRLFYTLHENVVVLLHCTYKQKKKTEQHDKNTAIRRANQIKTNGFKNVKLY